MAIRLECDDCGMLTYATILRKGKCPVCSKICIQCEVNPEMGNGAVICLDCAEKNVKKAQEYDRKNPPRNCPDWSDDLIASVRFMIGDNATVEEDNNGQIIIYTGKDANGEDL